MLQGLTVMWPFLFFSNEWCGRAHIYHVCVCFVCVSVHLGIQTCVSDTGLMTISSAIEFLKFIFIYVSGHVHVYMYGEVERGHWLLGSWSSRWLSYPAYPARTMSFSEVRPRSKSCTELVLSALFLESLTVPGIQLSAPLHCWGYRHCCNSWLLCRCWDPEPVLQLPEQATLPTEPSFQPLMMSLYKCNKFVSIPDGYLGCLCLSAVWNNEWELVLGFLWGNLLKSGTSGSCGNSA